MYEYRRLTRLAVQQQQEMKKSSFGLTNYILINFLSKNNINHFKFTILFRFY